LKFKSVFFQLTGVRTLRQIFFIFVTAKLVFPAFTAGAQEMFGITGSKYGGIHNALINPSLPVLSPFYLDVNVVTTHLFLQNNYLYLAKDEYKFSRFLTTNPQLPTHPPEGKFLYDYYTNQLKKGYINLRVMGPSFAVMMGKHAFGFYTNARSVTSVRNVPVNLAKFFFEGLTYPPQYDIRYQHTENISMAELAWAEFALNYSYLFKNTGSDYWTAGITLKNLQGYAGAYAYTNMLEYLVPDHDTLIVYHATGEGGISIPMDYGNNQYTASPLFRGSGYSLDIGLTYERKNRSGLNSYNFRKLCSQSYTPYIYRIGVSIIDIGRIKFKDNALKFNVNDGSTIWPGISDVEYTNMNNIVAQVSNQFFGNSTELITGNNFAIGLPAAISAQADVNIIGNWFVNGMAFLPVKLSTPSVVRPSLLVLGGRYDSRLIGFGVSASAYDYTNIHLGVNARFLGFFIGTEKLGGFLSLNDFEGIDFYGGIKINFLKGKCRSFSNTSCGNNEYKQYQQKKKGLFRK
jgi:hypothetical protein